jgi:ABC-type multidrug transport system fused ATPase/permease subunit
VRDDNGNQSGRLSKSRCRDLRLSSPHRAVWPMTHSLAVNVADRAIRLEWDQVEYEIPVNTGSFLRPNLQPKQILKGVSGSVLPEQMVAIMGSSGASKSTLLNVLAGRIGLGTIRESILANGDYRHEKAWNRPWPLSRRTTSCSPVSLSAKH